MLRVSPFSPKLVRLGTRAAVAAAFVFGLAFLGMAAGHATETYGPLKVGWLAAAAIGGLWAGTNVPKAVAVLVFSSAIVFKTKVALGIEVHTTHLLLLLLVLQLVQQVERIRLPRAFFLGITAMLLGAVVASVAGPDLGGSLFRGFGGLLLPMAALLAATTISRTRDLERLLLALGAAVLVEGFIALMQLTGHAFGPFAPLESGRVNGLFLHPNILGGYLATGTVLLLGVAVHVWSKSRTYALLLVLPMAFGLVGVAATLSRGSLIALAAGVAVLLLLTAGGKEAWLLVVLLAAAVAIAVPRVPQAERAEFQVRVQQLFQPGAETGRKLIYKQAFSAIRSHPVTGMGPLTFGQTVRTTGTLPGLEPGLEHAHNIVLEGLLSIGPLGMLGFLTLLAAAAGRCFRVRRVSTQPILTGFATGTLAALTAFLVSGMFDFLLWQVEVMVLLLVLIGTTVALERVASQRLDEASSWTTSRPRLGRAV
jgi:O-antigen ligase